MNRTTPTYNATKAAIHSYTIAMRAALAGKVEVIELAPPAVQTGLTPGQETRQEWNCVPPKLYFAGAGTGTPRVLFDIFARVAVRE